MARVSADVTLTGLSRATNQLRLLAELIPRQVAQALNEVAEETKTVAQERTPVEFGVLKASAKVDHATAATLAATITYGTEYAIYVHEVPARHVVGQWKFLESAMNDRQGTFASDMANALRGRL